MSEKEQLRQQIEEAFEKKYEFENDNFGGPGNGCDDYRNIPDDVFKKRHELRETYKTLKNQFKEKYGHEYDEKVNEEELKEKEFEKLYGNWYSSFMFSAFGSGNPASKEYYDKLKQWCIDNKQEGLKFIKEMLEREPNDIVMILQDLYAEKLGIKIEGFMPLQSVCNLWLNVLNKYEGLSKGKLKDYYKAYDKYKKYMDKHYMAWRPNLENDPNVTREEFERGERNKKSRRSWHDFPLSILTDEEISELHDKGYLINKNQMFHIEELKEFYNKVKAEFEKRKINNISEKDFDL